MEWFRALEERRRQERLTVEAFARRLGIAGSTWRAVRDGHLPAPWKFVRRALAVYPELSGVLVTECAQLVAEEVAA